MRSKYSNGRAEWATNVHGVWNYIVHNVLLFHMEMGLMSARKLKHDKIIPWAHCKWQTSNQNPNIATHPVSLTMNILFCLFESKVCSTNEWTTSIRWMESLYTNSMRSTKTIIKQ